LKRKKSEVKLTQQQIRDDSEHEQQILQVEYEQTQVILSAPSGADFVPVLDDLEEQCSIGPDGFEICKPIEENCIDELKREVAVFD
jgi:hypothetical protein